ncbi:hypothetical protein KAS42_02340 [bacterium]|nr:hypothetical protein [bacterium]
MKKKHLGERIEKFNLVYDFIERLFKILFFIVLIILVIWLVKYQGHSVDLEKTFDGLISKFIVIEQTAPMTVESKPITKTIDYLGIYQFGQLVFATDKPYEISGNTILFDKLLLKGRPDYEKNFVYADAEIKITTINEYIGLLVSGGSVEGPVLRGVQCQIVRK